MSTSTTITVLDQIANGEHTEPLSGEEFLEAMWKRRQDYWETKPAEERTHYVGFSTDPEMIRERLKIQCHAELFAAYVADDMLKLCPWQDLRTDLAKQVHDEFVHFKLVREHLRKKGGDYEPGYQPPIPEWRELISNVTLMGNIYYNDPIEQMVAMSAGLQFAIEGWDELFIHPHFMKHIEKSDPDLWDIFDSQIASDEQLHHENGIRLLVKCGDNLSLQKIAIRHFDSAASSLHKAGLGFRKYFEDQERQRGDKAAGFREQGDAIADSIEEITFGEFFKGRTIPA
jgi:hypothetical protein